MKHNYISNQVLKFIYEELPLFEHLETDYAIKTEADYKEAYHRLKSSIALLPSIHFYPSRSAVKKVLAYSKSLS